MVTNRPLYYISDDVFEFKAMESAIVHLAFLNGCDERLLENATTRSALAHHSSLSAVIGKDRH